MAFANRSRRRSGFARLAGGACAGRLVLKRTPEGFAGSVASSCQSAAYKAVRFPRRTRQCRFARAAPRSPAIAARFPASGAGLKLQFQVRLERFGGIVSLLIHGSGSTGMTSGSGHSGHLADRFATMPATGKTAPRRSRPAPRKGCHRLQPGAPIRMAGPCPRNGWWVRPA